MQNVLILKKLILLVLKKFTYVERHYVNGITVISKAFLIFDTLKSLVQEHIQRYQQLIYKLRLRANKSK